MVCTRTVIMGDGQPSEIDENRSIMIRIYQDHRLDEYTEFRINPKHISKLQEIYHDLEFMEIED